PLPADVLRDGGDVARKIDEAILNAASEEETSAPIERTTDKGTPHDTLENFIVSSLENVWPSYRWRGQLRSKAIASLQEQLTTVIFRLFSPPKKPIPATMQ